MENLFNRPRKMEWLLKEGDLKRGYKGGKEKKFNKIFIGCSIKLLLWAWEKKKLIFQSKKLIIFYLIGRAEQFRDRWEGNSSADKIMSDQWFMTRLKWWGGGSRRRGRAGKHERMDWFRQQPVQLITFLVSSPYIV